MNNQQEKMVLPSEKKRELKRLAHHLKPVVEVGKKGLSSSLVAEINNALSAHELIKIHVTPKLLDSEEVVTAIVRETKAEHIDTIGNIVILFRQREENSRFNEES